MPELKFDRARFDAGEMPTRTRDGRKVLKVVDSGLDLEYPLAAWIEKYGVRSYTRNGFYFNDGRVGVFDLVHEPKMRKVKVALLFDNGVPIHCKDVASLDDDHMAFWERRGMFFKVIEVEVPA